MTELTIEVHEREERGKNANRRLRASGRVPAIVYGGGREPVAIQIETRRLQELLRSSGENAIFLLKLGDQGTSRHTMIRDLAINPVTRRIVHVDFQRVKMDEIVRVSVPIELLGTPIGVKNEGGVLEFIHREVAIESLPGKIPSQLEIDVSGLNLGDRVTTTDLDLPEGVTMLEELDRVIASVAQPRVAEVEEEEEGELLEEVPEEPEVIGRGKGEEEAEEGSEEA